MLLERLVHDLSKMEGVFGSIAVTEDGSIVASSGVSEEDGALISFIGATSKELKKALNLTEKKIQTEISGEDYKIYVVSTENNYIGVFMEKNLPISDLKLEIDDVLEEL